ncbi:MAG: nitrate reductase molybdenum cofactor assembly chaperone [Methylococcaceae bacterium]|nr:MAG: nitrate reductase molybdenum cofactor assembly chaperone [Methylococcaceae bacterium]
MILKVLSVLLSYPEQAAITALDEMAEVVRLERRLAPEQQTALLAFIDAWRGGDLLDLQADYVALFDRGRFLSLHLFEHVHGESRDRGQAMVDLLQMYESHGFALAARELPDYIPLFLEYLSLQTPAVAVTLLQDAMPILGLLGARLNKRGSAYRVIFDALAGIAGAPAELERLHRQAAEEGPDATVQHMDEIWEEEAVSFMANPAVCRCGVD